MVITAGGRNEKTCADTFMKGSPDDGGGDQGGTESHTHSAVTPPCGDASEGEKRKCCSIGGKLAQRKLSMVKVWVGVILLNF